MFWKDKQNQHTSGQAPQEEKTQNPINKIRNEKKEITIDTAETQKEKKITRVYSKGSYANKRDNLEEMDKFLETYSLPKQSQEKTDNLNRPIIRNETKS